MITQLRILYYGSMAILQTLQNKKRLQTLLLSMSKNNVNALSHSRHQFVYKNYSWDIVKEEYLKMFRQSLT